MKPMYFHFSGMQLLCEQYSYVMKDVQIWILIMLCYNATLFHNY